MFNKIRSLWINFSWMIIKFIIFNNWSYSLNCSINFL
ncbi:GSCOCG00012528001-RA-CDS [Cotesia congregata]|nr:GSCOCG00012528001-RA-CDS [Cotesia congregata]